MFALKVSSMDIFLVGMMEVGFEQAFFEALKRKYKLRIEEANFAGENIPKYLLLDSTRNIHSYLILCCEHQGMLLSNYWDGINAKKQIVKLLRIQYSQLDRPLFFFLKLEGGETRIIESEVMRYELLQSPDCDIMEFMMDMSEPMSGVLSKIKNEL